MRRRGGAPSLAEPDPSRSSTAMSLIAANASTHTAAQLPNARAYVFPTVRPLPSRASGIGPDET